MRRTTTHPSAALFAAAADRRRPRRRPGEEPDPGHHDQHAGLRPARRARAGLREAVRLHGQDDRRRLRPGDDDGREGRGRRAARALAGRREEVHGRRLRHEPPPRDAQRLRHRRPRRRPGEDQGHDERGRRAQGDRRERRHVRLARRQVRDAQQGAGALEGRRRRRPRGRRGTSRPGSAWARR